MSISPVAGNSSKAMERHLGNSYLVVLAVSRVIDEIKAINGTIENGVLDNVYNQLGSIAIVANIKGEVTHVAAISDDIVAVSSIKEHVVRVSTDSAAINRVHDSIAEILRVQESADNIDRIHTSIDKLDRVFASIDAVDTVNTYIGNVNLVSEYIYIINNVAGNLSAIRNVDKNMAAVRNVSVNMGDVIEAGIYVNEIREAVAEATHQAEVSTLSAEDSEASRIVSDQNKEKTNQDKQAVAVMLEQTTEAKDDVIARQSNVQSLHDEVERDRQATHEAKVDAELAEQLSEMWATGGSNGVPSESNNAEYYSEVARNNANQTFKAGGYHTPVAGNEYPNITGLAVDTIWLIKFPSKGMKYTFTSGQLKGITVENGYMMVYDTPENSFDYIPTSLTGAGSVNGVNPDATNNITLKAINFSDIYSKEEVEAIVAALEQRVVNEYVPKTRTINGKPLSENVSLIPSDVGAVAACVLEVSAHDWDTLTEAGSYPVSHFSGANSPNVEGHPAIYTYGTLFVQNNGISIVQMYITDTNKMYVRDKFRTNPWRKWTSIGSDEAISIDTSIDLNTLSMGGTYNFYRASGATFTNAPPGFIYGTLQVIGQGQIARSFVTQIATDRSNGGQWIRTRNDGSFSWTSWKKIYSEAFKPTIEEIGALAVDGLADRAIYIPSADLRSNTSPSKIAVRGKKGMTSVFTSEYALGISESTHAFVDLLYIDGWSDSSGGFISALAMSKSNQHKAWLMKGNIATDEWLPPIQIYTEANKPTANEIGAVDLVTSQMKNGSLQTRSVNFLSGLVEVQNFEYSGFYRLNGPTIDGQRMPDLSIHCAHSNGRGHSRGIGFQYGPNWGITTTAWDNQGKFLGQKKIYTEADKPTALELSVAPSLVNKGVFIPAGTTAQRPAVNDYPDNAVALRMNTTLNEMEAVNKSGQVIPIGGGGMPALIPATTASLTVEKKKAYAVDMSDGVNKTVTVTQGMLDNDWFSINTTLWDKNVEGLTVTIDFGSEVITNGKKDFDSLVIDRPCIAYFTKVNGKWVWSDGAGLDGSYEKLLRRIKELESPPKSLFKGNELTGNSLTESLRNYHYIQVTGVTSFGGIQHEFNVTISSTNISPIGKYAVLSFSGANPTQEWIYLFLSFPTDTSFTLHGNTHSSSGWTKPAISSILGVNRL